MEVEDLIGQSGLPPGMIMEDACVGAISTRVDIRERIAGIVRASDTSGVFAAAAMALGEPHS